MTMRIRSESLFTLGASPVDTILVYAEPPIDRSWADADISAIVEEFLRAQIDPGYHTRPQIDPGGYYRAPQIDPGN